MKNIKDNKQVLGLDKELEKLYLTSEIEANTDRDTKTPLEIFLHPNRHNPTGKVKEGDDI